MRFATFDAARNSGPKHPASRSSWIRRDESARVRHKASHFMHVQRERDLARTWLKKKIRASGFGLGKADDAGGGQGRADWSGSGGARRQRGSGEERRTRDDQATRVGGPSVRCGMARRSRPRALEGRCISADPFAIPPSGVVAVREYGSSPRRRPRSVSTEIHRPSVVDGRRRACRSTRWRFRPAPRRGFSQPCRIRSPRPARPIGPGWPRPPAKRSRGPREDGLACEGAAPPCLRRIMWAILR
jgi:hypothetical protein